MNKKVISHRILILAVPLMCLLPFVTKPFHMDDPLFVWTAKHIQSHPTDFFGFNVIWYHTEMPMYAINQNPPLASYFIAVAALFTGWNDTAIHSAFLIFALGLSLGTYCLAKPLCAKPHIAALMSVLTPVFLISSSNVMTDTPMVAFYVWAVVFWMRGLETNQMLHLFMGSVLIVLSALTKYFGMTLIPLLFVYSMAAKRRSGAWMLFLLIPVLVLAGYQWLTDHMYGQGLLTAATGYATMRGVSSFSQLLPRTLTAFAFAGGCLASGAFYAPLLWSRRYRLIGWMLTVTVILILAVTESIGQYSLYDNGTKRWDLIIQFSLFAAAGIHVLALAVSDMLNRREPASVLLFLWITGTFLFAGFLNWTINARSIYPMLPAASILAMRRFDHRKISKDIAAALPLIPALFIAVMSAYADYSFATAEKDAAHRITEEFRISPHTVWFQGHWGFQYYMESFGNKALDFKKSVLTQGDFLVIPPHNTNVFFPDKNKFRLIKTVEATPFKWVGIMQDGGGFYSSLWGPLPFAFVVVKPLNYLIFQVI